MKKLLTKVLLLTVSVCFIFSSCAKKSEKIRVGYLPITLSLPFFVAVEKGFFTDAGLEIEKIPFTTADQLTNAVAAENIDISANTSMSTFMTTYEKMPGFAKIYMVSYHTPENFLDALLIKQDSKIIKPEELKGMKIGLYPGSTNVMNLTIALKNYLNPKDDIEMLQLPPQTQIEALASGQVAALYTLEPLVTVATSRNIGKILIQGVNPTYQTNPYPGGTYIISSEYFAKNSKNAKKFIEAIYRAVDFIKSNEKDARKYFEFYTPIKGEIAIKTHIGGWWKLDEIQKDKVQKLSDIFLKNGELEKIIKTSELYLKIK